MYKMLLDQVSEDEEGKFQNELEEDLRKQLRYEYSDLNSENIMKLIMNNCDIQDIPYN